MSEDVKIEYDTKMELNTWVPILKEFMVSDHKNMRIYCPKEKMRNIANAMKNYKRRNKDKCSDIIFSVNGEYLYVVKISQYASDISVTYN